MFNSLREEIEKNRKEFNLTPQEIQELDVAVMQRKLLESNITLRKLTDKFVEATQMRAQYHALEKTLQAEIHYIKDFQKAVQTALRTSVV